MLVARRAGTRCREALNTGERIGGRDSRRRGVRVGGQGSGDGRVVHDLVPGLELMR